MKTPGIAVIPVEDLEQLVERAVERALGRGGGPARGATPELLSQRQAARLLGVDRGTTLAELIRDGRIRTVPVSGRARIPRAELDRLLAEGMPAPAPRAKRAPRPPRRPTLPSTTDPAALRGLDLDKL